MTHRPLEGARARRFEQGAVKSVLVGSGSMGGFIWASSRLVRRSDSFCRLQSHTKACATVVTIADCCAALPVCVQVCWSFI